jgi:uncharacterized glyoxalase superfamily protein PhnB
MLGDEFPEMEVVAPDPASKALVPAGVMLYVSDVDALFEKAVSHGARPVMPPTDMFWGDRYCKLVDPFGQVWALATHQRDVSPEECVKAMADWSKPDCPGSK